ncbi:MAG TPA: hypothetical protein VM536_21735 [Chloroflexia bacterium]|nr:hypothetical protein [Chloroflexia bacterium]
MYCAHCGEPNPAGGTCGKCGSLVSPAPGKGTPNGRRCPMCMAVNASDALFCASCGARVVLMDDEDAAGLDFLQAPQVEQPLSLSPEAQMALNMERQRELFASGEDKPIDDDLQRVVANPPSTTRPVSVFGSRGGSDGGLGWLDSLRDTSAELPMRDAQPMPDLADEETSAVDVASADASLPVSTTTPDVPDWLANLRSTIAAEEAPPAAPVSPTPAPVTLPSWLQPAATEAAEPLPPAGDVSLPAWLSGAAAPAPTTPATGDARLPIWLTGPAAAADSPAAAAPSALPSWLEPPPEAPAASETGLPAWMAEEAPAFATPAAPAGGPNWMAGDAADDIDAAPASAAPEAPLSPLGDIELPSWLQAAGEAPPPVAATGRKPLTGKLFPLSDDTGDEDTVAAAADPAADEGGPAWMRDVDEPGSHPPLRATVPLPADQLPAWMKEPEATPVPDPLAHDADGLPAWMSGSAGSAPQQPISASDAGELPAWMSGMEAGPGPQPAPPGGSDQLPGWMSDSTAAPAEQAAPPVDRSAAPAWMHDIPGEPDQQPVPDVTPDVLPAWMNDLPADPGIPAPTAPRDLPSWMDTFGSASRVESTHEQAVLGDPSPAVDGLPAWMGGPPAPTSETGEDGLPRWMSGPPAAAEEAQHDADGLPSWMGGATTPAAESQGVADDGLPNWMSGPPPSANVPPAAADSLSAWMSGATPAVDRSLAAADEAAAAPPPPASTGVDGFPAWMSPPAATLDAAALEGGAEAVPPPPADSGGFLSEEDLPAWLRALQARPAAPVPETPPAPMPVQSDEDEVPAWLRALGTTEDDISPVALGGGTSTAEPAPVRVIRARAPRAGAVEVFERLLAPAPAVTPVVAGARRPVMAMLTPERLLALALLVVCVVMWLVAPFDPSAVHAPRPDTANGAGQTFYGTLTNLPAGKPVLLVYDWDATRYGEMHALSSAVTRVLSRSGHSFATISTIPEGVGFALQVTSEVVPTQTTTVRCPAAGVPWSDPFYGTRLLHLGYRPGNEAGLAELAAAKTLADVQPYEAVGYCGIRRAPLLSGAPGLGQFGAIVLLSAEEHPLRMWIEQVGSRLTTVPLLAALPEGQRPVAVPYLNGNNGHGLLTAAVFGLPGAQELSDRLDSDPAAGRADAADRDLLGKRMHTESAALFTLAFALLLGFLAGAYRWINRRSNV